MTLPRRILPGQTYLITRRTLRRHFLLRPDRQLNQLFLYLVALFAERFHMEVAAIQVLSDHYHMVVTDPLGHLPHFLQQLHRMLALSVKALRRWDGPLWEPCSVSAVALLTPEAEAQEMAYTSLNVVRAGLVAAPAQWPGVTTSLDDVGGRAITAERPDQLLDPESGLWPAKVTLRLTMPPKLAALGGKRARAMIRRELERQREEVSRERRAKGLKKVLGAKRCLQISPYDRASSWEPKRSTNPVLAVGKGLGELLSKAVRELRDFYRCYYEALASWCEGNRKVVFPAGTWWLVEHHRAQGKQFVSMR
ncbi:MAG: transposase [Deltaproteobacteria bacterium]|jgi:REP element-mobilizing transposase RayT|nr:transposase [Deltaproteobacteria bacterium]MBW2530619.1 transposase [Deltaproteobacteria bacterium]